MFGKESITFVIAWTICNCYTLKSGTEVLFPKQIEVFDHSNAFVRVDSTNETTLLKCPLGYYFSSDELKCKRSLVEEVEPDPIGVCPKIADGLISYSFNCRKFLHCFQGKPTLQNCAAHLLFKRGASRCEWPESSDCCEYLENQLHSQNK